jgi:hypothetical protein
MGTRHGIGVLGVATLIGIAALPAIAAASSSTDPTVPAAAAGAAATRTVVMPTADAFVREAEPDRNTGDDLRLRTRKQHGVTTFIRFEVPGGIGTVGRATLRLRARPGNGARIGVRKAVGAWSEGSLTAASAPDLGRLLAKVDVPSNPGWIKVDVSALVDGPGTYDLAVVGLQNRAAFFSRESSLSPRLVISDRAAKVVVAAGDIACSPQDPDFNAGQGTAERCRQLHTSNLALGVMPDAVAALGDLQYENAELAYFTAAYDPSWGRLFASTHPAVGNHEYRTPAASGYYTYWGSLAGDPNEGWYSYDLGAWHVIVLNTNCSEVGCDPTGTQAAWLEADLAGSDALCTLAYGHHPRFSSGDHGDFDLIDDLYATLHEHGVDVYLAGHDHHYERTSRLDPSGGYKPHGIRNFVVGTGGKSLRTGTVTPKASTQAWDDSTYGILRLDLNAASYGWEFIADGDDGFTDAGRTTCR